MLVDRPDPGEATDDAIWVEIEVSAEDGQLVVDTAVRYIYERGQWSDPKAFVKMA